jgi:hypothetical protein
LVKHPSTTSYREVSLWLHCTALARKGNLSQVPFIICCEPKNKPLH